MESKEIARFIIEFGNNFYEFKDLEHQINKHIEYDTIIVLRNSKDMSIKAVARFNIDGSVADILDVVISSSEKNKKVIQLLTSILWTKYPVLKYIAYERAGHDDKGVRYYRIEKFLGKEKTTNGRK